MKGNSFPVVAMKKKCTPNKSNNNSKLASFHFGENDFVIHFFKQGSRIDEYLSSGVKNYQ